jgi:hypothetical protein
MSFKCREIAISEDTKGCVFCDIVAGEADAYRIYENPRCLCILEPSGDVCG